MACVFSDLSIKSIAASTLLSVGSLTLAEVYHSVTGTFRLRAPRGEKSRPLATSVHSLASLARGPSWKLIT